MTQRCRFCYLGMSTVFGTPQFYKVTECVFDNRVMIETCSVMAELKIVLWNPRRNQSQCSVQRIKEGTVQLKCDDTRCRTGGAVKGKLANGVGS
jgi:hypothetical protein